MSDIEISTETHRVRSPGRRRLGWGLVGLSFLLYGGILLVSFLPGSVHERVALAGMLAVSGEVSFWVGALMLGREAASKLRRLPHFRRWLGKGR